MSKTRSLVSAFARRMVIPLVLAVAALGFAAAPASAQVSAGGWTFQAEVICKPVVDTVAVSVTGVSATSTPAYTAYKIWYRYNNSNDWSLARDWTQLGERDSFLVGPDVLYNSAGIYQFYVHFAVWQGTGWSMVGENAIHWVQKDGYTVNSGDAACTV
jgi:hypothetical protein